MCWITVWEKPNFMHLYVIRHGQRADADTGFTGDRNVALSALGHEQAAALGSWFAKRRLDALYSSCLLRAMETAQHVQQATQLPQQVWPVFCESESSWRWRLGKNPQDVEPTVGWRDGRHWDDQEELIKARQTGDYYLLSELSQRFTGCELTQPFRWPDAWWMALEGQTMEIDFARVVLGAQALLNRHGENDHVAVVCHANSGNMLMHYLLGLNRFPSNRFMMNETCVNWLEVTEAGSAGLRMVNGLYHLPPHLQPEWLKGQA